ncbi:MAG: energy transducer TonB [Bacteroidia bacterium]|nr:energy transducer TonB [Bacteroidia bacterium]
MKAKDYSNLSMDEIVFEDRNKNYGAYVLRTQYSKNIAKAITISALAFVLTLFIPQIIDALGLFKKVEEKVELVTIETTNIEPPTVEDVVPPPPVEIVEIVPPTQRFLEILATVAKEVPDNTPPPDVTTIIENVGEKTIKGTPDADPIIKDPEPFIEGPVTPETTETPDQKPEFKNGNLSNWLAEKLIYPDYPANNGIGGTAMVYFIIDENGNINSVSILKSSGNSELDAEAKKVISKIPAGSWRPGKNKGKVVRTKMKVPITFTPVNLDDL